MVKHTVPLKYREPIIGAMDRVYRKSLTTSSIAAVVLLAIIYIIPQRAPEVATVEDIPERFAKLILEKPKPPKVVTPVVPESNPIEDKIAEVAEPEPEKPKPRPERPKPTRRSVTKPKVDVDAGKQGRERAKRDVETKLASVTGSVDKVLDNISSALPASGDAKPTSRRPSRRRSVRKGRGGSDIGQVATAQTGSSADVTGSAIGGSPISIAQIEDVEIADGDGGGGGGGSNSGGSGGELRSNQSLLSVVRRYAPGIQYCYDNQLKSNPNLRGKVVVSLTVSATGKVLEAIVVQDSLGSKAVTECVLGQIFGWKFPKIATGDVTFKTPFVFTPPN